jgi:hypothetical protein
MTTRSRAHVVSSYTIVKGTMIEETYTACKLWDASLTKDENFAYIRKSPEIPAKSASWRNDVCKVIHRRFDFSGPDQPLVILAHNGCPFEQWKPLYLWHMTRDEFLLRDFLGKWLFQQHREGALRVTSADVIPYLKSLGQSGRYTETWTNHTMSRVAVGLLRAATDFGILRGTIAREFTSYHLPDPCFVYLLHALAESIPNARAIIQSPDWHLFLMDADDVERQILRLHQFQKLHYEVAGSIAQLTLPCASALDYARRMAA